VSRYRLVSEISVSDPFQEEASLEREPFYERREMIRGDSERLSSAPSSSSSCSQMEADTISR